MESYHVSGRQPSRGGVGRCPPQEKKHDFQPLDEVLKPGIKPPCPARPDHAAERESSKFLPWSVCKIKMFNFSKV